MILKVWLSLYGARVVRSRTGLVLARTKESKTGGTLTLENAQHQTATENTEDI